jgi:hypothetical protein
VSRLLAILALAQVSLAARAQQPVTQTQKPPTAEQAAPETTPAPTAAPEGQRRRARRGGEFDTTELQVGADQKIELRYDQTPIEDAAYAAIQSPVEGEVVPFVKSRPLKLKTPVDLRFGDTVIAAHNHGPEYPGVYSLWLKSVGGQWRLVFNDLPDVWGTQHDPARDKAEVPLEVGTAAEPVKTFTAKLEPAAGGGILRLRWGSTEWSVPFSVD